MTRLTKDYPESKTFCALLKSISVFVLFLSTVLRCDIPHTLYPLYTISNAFEDVITSQH